MPDTRHPEQWVIRVCPLCRCQVYETSVSHTGDCANRHKIFVPDELFVVPKGSEVRFAPRTMTDLPDLDELTGNGPLGY